MGSSPGAARDGTAAAHRIAAPAIAAPATTTVFFVA
jgi:hypothetical protein